MTPASLVKLGFYFGTSGGHAGRSLMLDDLELLMEHAPADAANSWFSNAILNENLLAKSSVNNRDHANRRMRQLYALDASTCLFRVFRGLYLEDKQSRSTLAVLLAMARDALFRKSAEIVLAAPLGTAMTSESFRQPLDLVAAGRMGEETLRHACGNVFSSWNQAGYLSAEKPRRRVQAPVSWAAVAFALFLGWLDGERGRLLFETPWAKVLDRDFDELLRHAATASRQGHLELLNAGGVIEVRFPGYLTNEEMQLP
jgi:hypothetical protein